MPRKLTDNEQVTFEVIRNDPGIGLVQTMFDGEETAVIVEFGDGTGTPLAVLVTATMFPRIANPFDSGNGEWKPFQPYENPHGNDN